MEYKLGDKILCLSSRDLRLRALNLSSNGYGVAVIGFKDIDEHILTVTELPEKKQGQDMTREEAITELMQIYMSLSEEKKKALDVLMAQAEKTCDIEKSNFDVRQYKLDTDTAYECGYNAGLQAQADGEYISKNNAITSVCQWGTTLERTGTYTITVAEMKQTITDMLCELPSVAIPPEHDGCKDCRWQSQSETEMPCKQCMHNYTDEWEREKPTDTITMTREEFSEKLMEHYRQGRADEKAYQNGEIMQSFNPD